MGRASTMRVQPPTAALANGSSGPLRMIKKSDSVHFEKVSNQRLARMRARSKQLTGNDVQVEHLGKAREECFVVFD